MFHSENGVLYIEDVPVENIAREVGTVGVPLLWDPAAEKFTNSPEGNEMLSREQRKGYELPEV